MHVLLRISNHEQLTPQSNPYTISACNLRLVPLVYMLTHVRTCAKRVSVCDMNTANDSSSLILGINLWQNKRSSYLSFSISIFHINLMFQSVFFFKKIFAVFRKWVFILYIFLNFIHHFFKISDLMFFNSMYYLFLNLWHDFNNFTHLFILSNIPFYLSGVTVLILFK